MMSAENERSNVFNKVPLRGIQSETIVLFLIVSITLLGDSSLYVLLPIHAKDIGVPLGMVGVLLSINRLVRLFTNYAVSTLHVHLGSRIMIAVSVLLASVTTLIYGLPVGLVSLFASRVIWGLCWSTLRFESFENITNNIDDNNRGRASGLYCSITRIGSLVSLLIGGILVERTGYRNTFYWFSLITGLVGMSLYFLWKHYRQNKHQTGLVKEVYDLQACHEQIDNVQHASTHVIGISRLFCYAFTFINGWIGSGLLITTIGYIMMIKFGKDLAFFGLTIGISMAASFLTSTNWFYSVVLSVFFGWLSDKFSHIKILTIFCLLQVVALFTASYATHFLLFAFAATLSFAGDVNYFVDNLLSYLL